MDRDTLDSLDKETLIRLILSQAEAIERLTREIEALRADNAALRAKLDQPPKTPENSNTPPSQGHKASGEESNYWLRVLRIFWEARTACGAGLRRKSMLIM